MVVSLHIFIAVISLLLVAFSFLKTSRGSLAAGYTSVALTLASGIYLVLSQPSRMLHVCVMGLIYLSIATVALVGAHVRRARLQHNEAL